MHNYKISKSPFKPGDESSYRYKGEWFNAKIDWRLTLKDLVKIGYTIDEIISHTGVTTEQLRKVVFESCDTLTFKQGATILSLHEKYFPKKY